MNVSLQFSAVDVQTKMVKTNETSQYIFPAVRRSRPVSIFNHFIPKENGMFSERFDVSYSGFFCVASVRTHLYSILYS